MNITVHDLATNNRPPHGISFDDVDSGASKLQLFHQNRRRFQLGEPVAAEFLPG